MEGTEEQSGSGPVADPITQGREQRTVERMAEEKRKERQQAGEIGGGEEPAENEEGPAQEPSDPDVPPDAEYIDDRDDQKRGSEGEKGPERDDPDRKEKDAWRLTRMVDGLFTFLLSLYALDLGNAQDYRGNPDFMDDLKEDLKDGMDVLQVRCPWWLSACENIGWAYGPKVMEAEKNRKEVKRKKEEEKKREEYHEQEWRRQKAQEKGQDFPPESDLNECENEACDNLHTNPRFCSKKCAAQQVARERERKKKQGNGKKKQENEEQ